MTLKNVSSENVWNKVGSKSLVKVTNIACHLGDRESFRKQKFDYFPLSSFVSFELVSFKHS